MNDSCFIVGHSFINCGVLSINAQISTSVQLTTGVVTLRLSAKTLSEVGRVLADQDTLEMVSAARVWTSLLLGLLVLQLRTLKAREWKARHAKKTQRKNITSVTPRAKRTKSKRQPETGEAAPKSERSPPHPYSVDFEL